MRYPTSAGTLAQSSVINWKLRQNWYTFAVFLWPSQPTFRILLNHWEFQNLYFFQVFALSAACLYYCSYGCSFWCTYDAATKFLWGSRIKPFISIEEFSSYPQKRFFINFKEEMHSVPNQSKFQHLRLDFQIRGIPVIWRGKSQKSNANRFTAKINGAIYICLQKYETHIKFLKYHFQPNHLKVRVEMRLTKLKRCI